MIISESKLQRPQQAVTGWHSICRLSYVASIICAYILLNYASHDVVADVTALITGVIRRVITGTSRGLNTPACSWLLHLFRLVLLDCSAILVLH